MERKHGFFSIVRGLSPSRSRAKSPARGASPMSSLLRGRRNHNSHHVSQPDPLIFRSGSLRPTEALSPLKEGPDPDGNDVGDSRMEGRLLLGVLGAPLAPVHVSALDPFPPLSIKDTPIESSSAQYIIQQYTAASGGQKLQNSIHNAYAMGRDAESGGFVLWQMNPDMWYVELALGGSKVHAGCNGKHVWSHTPWLGAHAAKGPVRPLRRALQGLDPRTTASMFSHARCVGEKKVNGEDCFTLNLSADLATLKARSEKTGLLVHLEDSQLTKIQNNGGDAMYWETTINSFLEDYRPVEGITIAHSGRSVVTLFRFGDTAMSHTRTRMEEAWVIEEVSFNVPGL
ncbi:putative GAST1 protein precursor [Hibiscus syriacus]|uniref:GAST1 protein n=1 Tax=Hibiscus syriacus TaxID=106335 RepID=A0A6A2YWY6_HIBSY|nr:putative GAST1 protein precursor [Hibiscus syriacus]